MTSVMCSTADSCQVQSSPSWEKQEFVYSVFNRCVQTHTGKSIVRKHDHDYNAQAVYTKLVQQATTSTKAKLSRDKLVIELTTSLLDSTGVVLMKASS